MFWPHNYYRTLIVECFSYQVKVGIMEHLTCQIKTNRTWKNCKQIIEAEKYKMIYYFVSSERL